MDTVTRMKAFIEVVDNEGYSAAARRMGRSKALLSKYVRELEDDLGVLLINRTTRQFSMTEAGERYYALTLDILQRLDDAREAVRDASAEIDGTLRIAAPRSLGSVEAMLPLVAFAKAYPLVKLEIDMDDRVVDLVEERFDVAIRVAALADSSLIVKKLMPSRLLYCASPAFLEKYGVPNEPADLADWPNIIDTNWRGRNTWPFVDKDGKRFTQSVRSIMEVNDPQVCKRAALEGLGATMLPEFAIKNELNDGQLISILEDYVPTDAAFWVVYADRRHISAKVRAFVDFMSDWFKKER